MTLVSVKRDKFCETFDDQEKSFQSGHEFRFSSVNFLLFNGLLPVPRLRGRLGQVRCRKASWGCFGDAVSKMADENRKVQLVESDIRGGR